MLPLLVSACLTSCTTYQVMTISSRESAPQNTSSEFVIDNDSLEISYNFNGRDGLVRMKIRNKLEKPCFVDWKRSALIVNNHSTSYASKTVEINASVSGSSYSVTRNYGIASGDIHGTAEIPSDMEFLPPHAYVSRELTIITNQPLGNLPDSLFTKKKLTTIDNMNPQVKLANFTAVTSPLVFQSYLTVVIGDTRSAPIAWQHNFYVSELMKTSTLPDLFNGSTRGDRFYVLQREGEYNTANSYGVVQTTSPVPPVTRKGQ